MQLFIGINKFCAKLFIAINTAGQGWGPMPMVRGPRSEARGPGCKIALVRTQTQHTPLCEGAYVAILLSRSRFCNRKVGRFWVDGPRRIRRSGRWRRTTQLFIGINNFCANLFIAINTADWPPCTSSPDGSRDPDERLFVLSTLFLR